MEDTYDKNIIKIKTICEFLFFDQYKDTSTFQNFEKCLQPLLNNIDISIEKVFKDICGPKKKYITFDRFSRAYLNYLKGKNKSPDIKLFFDKLINSILKDETEFIGEDKEDTYIFSTNRLSKKAKYLTMIQVLSDKEEKIHGINLEYDEAHESKMFPNILEDELFINLEMNLDILNDNSLSDLCNKNYSVIQEAYRDVVTHVFGTIDKESGYITFLGFKCSSGKNSFVGFPKGEGFLFGKFGWKFHDLRIQMTEEGISKLEIGFKKNTKNNYFLKNIFKKLLSSNLNENEIINEEESLKDLDEINDKDDIAKLTTTSIIADNHFFNTNIKDKYFGNDYKEVVDQSPRKWILNSIKEVNENEEASSLSIEDNLKDTLILYEKEKKKTLIKSTLKKSKIKINNVEGFDPSQNPFGFDGNIDEQNFGFVQNPLFIKEEEENELEFSVASEKSEKDDLMSSLHNSKIYKRKEKKNSIFSNQIKIRRSKIKWDGNINKNTDCKIFFNKDNYQKLKEKVGMFIYDQFIEDRKERREEEDVVQNAILNTLVPFPGNSGDKNYKKDKIQIYKEKQKKLKTKNAKGKIISLDNNIKKKNIIQEESKEDDIIDDSKGILYSDAKIFWDEIKNISSNTEENFNENQNNYLKSKFLYNKGKMKSKKIDTDDSDHLKKVVEKWKYFKNRLKKITGVYLLQTIGNVLKAMHLLENNSNNLDKFQQIKLYKVLEENEKIINLLSNNIETEDNSEINHLIPDEHPENFTSLFEIQKHLDNFNKLLQDKNLKTEERKKIEQLKSLYLKQKNFLIENEEKKAKENLEEKLKIDVNKYLIKEIEKRNNAKKKEQEKIEEKLRKKKQEEEDKEKTIIVKPINLGSVKTKIFYNQKPKGKEKWKDNLFVSNKKSICPYNKEGWIIPKNVEKKDLENWEYIKENWCRFEEIQNMKNFDVFIEGATIDDIQQGNIGDCYFLSAVGALCKKTEFFEKLFHMKEKSSQNIYGIYLYLNGRWKLVLLDDYFPYSAKDFKFKQLFFSSSCQNEIWVSLIEKAWAKVNGFYVNIGCGGYSYEAFDVLTEAYTEHIYIDKKNEDKLWEKMKDAIENEDYALTAGTPSKSKLLRLDKVGLVEKHAYTIINIKIIETSSEKVKLVKIKNPWGNKEFTGEWSNYSKKWTPQLKSNKNNEFPGKNDDGIFYMSYKDFLKYFFILDICKLKTGYKSTYCKINKKESKKCQVIKFVLEKEYPKTFIQLYQKNPRIIRKNRTYHPEPVMAYIILSKEENNKLKYINSVTSIPTLPENEYKMHISLEEDLKPGTYFIFCDVIYRYLNPDYTTYGYTITFYSEYLMNKIEKVTEKIDTRLYLEKVMIDYSMHNLDYKYRRGLEVYATDNYNNKIPFKVLCFYNPTGKDIKAKVDIKEKEGKSFCIYNDSISSELDTSVIKKIKSKNANTILVLGYTLLSNFQINYEVLGEKDKRTYENCHPVFNSEKEEVDEEGRLYSYSLENYNGYTIGIENTSNMKIKLKLILEGLCCIDYQYYEKGSLIFEISGQSKKIFNARVRDDKIDPMFYFEFV